MANEFVHVQPTADNELTRAEFEHVGLHVFNNQATGDVMYASSTTQLSRLGIGSTNDTLQVVGGIPAWVTNPTFGDTAVAGTLDATGAVTFVNATLSGTLDIETYAAVGNGRALSAGTTLIVDRDFSTAGSGEQLAVGGVITATSGTSDLELVDLGVNGGIIINSGGTHANVGTLHIREPNITETSGSVTNAYTVRISGSPTEGANNYALWVDAGAVQIDETLDVTGVGTFSSTIAINGRAAARRVNVPLNDFLAHQASPTFALDGGAPGWHFDDTSDERIAGGFIIPTDYVSGGTFQLYYVMASATTNEARVGMNASSNASGEDADTSTGAQIVDITVPGTAGFLGITAYASTGGTFVAGEYVSLRVKRHASHANDDATGDFILIGLTFEYTADS